MSQIIKKQIKRSIPFFVIISLVMSTTAMGLFFNLDYSIYNLLTKSDSAMITPAKAVDTASTTVEVKNAPPAFTVQPAEVPASTSTNPVNVGSNLTIVAQASDGENNSFYLIICSTNAINIDTSGGENHSCGDVTFGSSTIASAGLTGGWATTTWAVADPVPSAQTDEWYAFICDNHATQADCSLASQGDPADINGSSPFYINHAPVFDSISTTDDNKDPGNAADPFEVTAVVTDGDTLYTQDVLHLYVCSTNDWTVGGGCTNGQLCYGTSTSPNVSCEFATGTPAMDGAYPYYGFIRDEHNFAATGNSRTNNYNVNNVAPTISSVLINGSEDIVLNMRNMSEYVASSSSVSVSDNNGCLDIVNGGWATSTIYWSDVTSEQNCVADDDDCYPIATGDCAIVSGTCTGGSDAVLSYICTTTLAFHSLPTDDATGTPYGTTNWLSGLTVYDDDDAYGTATSASGVDVITLTALEVTELTIPYGQIKAGQNSGAYNATTTIVNYGNSPLDTGVDVNDMDKDDLTPNAIEAENQEFDLANFVYGSGSWSVEEASSTYLVDTITVRPTSAQIDISDQVFWGIGIPAGKPSGTYTGMNIFTAILDDDNW